MRKSSSRRIQLLTAAVLSFATGALAAPPKASPTPKSSASQAASGKLVPAPPAAIFESPPALFDYVAQVVHEHFYDQTFLGLDWEQMVQATRQQLGSAPTQAAVRQALDGLLTQLHPSHARLLGDDEAEYWALASAYSGRLDGAKVRQAGVWLERRGARHFVRTVAAGSPADLAGLSRGDEIVAIDGAAVQPVEAWRRLGPNEAAKVSVRHLPWEQPHLVSITPVVESSQEAELRNLVKGQRLVNVPGHKVAYVPLLASSHPAFREALEKAARDAEKSADAMILDLRDGAGGDGLAYLEPFLPTQAPVKAPTFTKPMVVLINGGTRGGREWLAWFLRQQKRATLVGSRTAGAFLPGQVFEIEPRHFLLYLAANDRTGYGAQLEGQGLRPDVEVEDELLYAAGKDPQLQQAVTVATDMLKKGS